MNLLHKLFTSSKKDEKLVCQENVIAEAPTIGEPVLSLAKAMEDSSNWELVRGRDYFSVSLYDLVHIKTKLNVSITKTTFSYSQPGTVVDYRCTVDWMTNDEKEFIVSAFKKFIEDKIRVESEYKLMENQIEREKFMDAFV